MIERVSSQNFDCYVHPGLQDVEEIFFLQLCNKLKSINVAYEVTQFITNTRETLVFYPAHLWWHEYRDNNSMIQGLEGQNIVLVGKNEQEKELGVPRKGSYLWFSPDQNLDYVSLLVSGLNESIFSNRKKKLKEKMQKTIDTFNFNFSKKYEVEADTFNKSFFTFDTISLHKALEETLLKKFKIKNPHFLSEQELLTGSKLETEFLVALPNEYLGFSAKLTPQKWTELNAVFKAYVDQKKRLDESAPNAQDAVFEQSFRQLTLPMALISASGDILVHNQSFIKLNLTPQNCLKYQNHEKIILENDEAYKVTKIAVDSESKTFFVSFSSVDWKKNKTEKNSSTEELGIISSSIAHELNNPLAGIMAAIGLLSLDDNWSEDALSDLEEMKRGSLRCKVLVETFLGFSRMTPLHTAKGSFSSSLEQALNLIRFRLVENNIKLSFKYDLKDNDRPINSSIFSMVFYLIFGELITAFSHHSLITKDKVDNKLIDGKIILEKIGKDKVKLVIRVNSEFDFQDQVRNAKLIKHLLSLENFDLSLTAHEIIVSS